MNKFKITGTVMLSFLTERDQYDALFDSNDGFSLECDGRTIWAIEGDKRHESITMANAIDIWLEQGKIEKL